MMLVKKHVLYTVLVPAGGRMRLGGLKTKIRGPWPLYLKLDATTEMI